MKKKKRPRASKKSGTGGAGNPSQPQSNKIEEEKKVIESLVFGSVSLEGGAAAYKEAKREENKVIESLVFGSVSLEEGAAAYKEAKGDANKAAEILGNLVLVEESGAEDQSTTCSSSSGNWASSSGSSVATTSSSSEVYAEAYVGRNGVRNQKARAKKVVAVAGTVSTMLGKDYVRSVQKRTSLRSKGYSEGSWSEAEQFLWSALGEDNELSMDVVSDVLCGCGYDVEKALNILVELSSSLAEESQFGKSDATINEDPCSLLEFGDSLTDRKSDSASHSSETDFRENEGCKEHYGRSHFHVLAGNDASFLKRTGYIEPELSQQVLESLFNMSTPKSAEREPNTMNWSDVVRKMTSLGQGVETYSEGGAAVRHSATKGDDYQALRQDAKKHWESMKLCYKKAATAFSKGDKNYASCMSEQGRLHNKIAREAEEKASRDIFVSRNKGIENVITIDLHGQHVKQAMRLLKLHLLFGAYVRSVRSFRVITGCGSHGVGKSKLKQSVINLLERESIKWTEENRGMLLVRLDQQTQLSFLDSDSEGD